MNQPRKNAERCSDPHEHKHLRPKPRTDVQALLTCNDVLEDNEHNRCDNGGSSSEQSGYECPDGEGERPPPRIQYNWSQKDVDEIHTHARQEEAKHKMARNLDQVQNVVDFSWQGDGSAGQQFVEQDLDGVEPVQGLRGRAVRYPFVVVAFAEVPEADLVEVVQAQGAGEGVDERDVSC
jgi:hypothetical protein